MTTAQGGRAVLVVEDDALLRLDIAMAFENAGFTVVEAASADEALEVLDAGTAIDLIFTDVDMPGAHNGIDLARIAKQARPELPVIVTSGKQRPDAPGVALFFPKPYDSGVIVSRAQALAA